MSDAWSENERLRPLAIKDAEDKAVAAALEVLKSTSGSSHETLAWCAVAELRKGAEKAARLGKR